jgi:hypothetical protein
MNEPLSWMGVSPAKMACNQANHLLPLEIFFLAMLVEEHKEITRLRRQVEELETQYAQD